MARRPPERPWFEPPVQPGPPVPPPEFRQPERPDRDPLRAMAPTFATLAAIGVVALALWLPLREAQDESLQHYPSTQYVDVQPGTTHVWHNVQWRMTTFRQIPWKYYAYATPPPDHFVRLHILLHCRLLGPKAKLKGQAAGDYLYGDLEGETFDYELRDRDERVWDTISNGTDPKQWTNYRPADGLDLEIYADVPPSKADEAMLVVKFDDHKDDFNFKKTPSPREQVLRFVR